MSENEQIKKAVQHFIIYFGLLEGIWINTGVNPFLESLNALALLLENTNYAWCIDAARFVWFFVVPLVQIGAIYVFGGILGCLALIIVFVGGILITSEIGVFMAIGGILLAYYAFSSEKKIRVVLKW
jgi:hypothetical protein